jgi:arylsulfatase A-like enzyme
VQGGGRWPVRKAIDVAPLVAELLGIEPPRDARGQSPLAR